MINTYDPAFQTGYLCVDVAFFLLIVVFMLAGAGLQKPFVHWATWLLLCLAILPNILFFRQWDRYFKRVTTTTPE